MTDAVVGIDGCARGWIGIVLDGGPPSAVFGVGFAEVVAAAGEVAGKVAVVAVDMPVGLATTAARTCDVEARLKLGARRSTLFTVPVRDALGQANYADANAHNRSVTGHGISRQAWALGAKIREVEHWRVATGEPVWEVHPELSFAAMGNGAPLAAGKKSWAGMRRRLSLLSQAGIELSADLGPAETAAGSGPETAAGRAAGTLAATDDVIDAAAVAWSARRIRDGQATSLPDPPEADEQGRPIAIWT